jgi:hypothetical protein
MLLPMLGATSSCTFVAKDGAENKRIWQEVIL